MNDILKVATKNNIARTQVNLI